MSARPGRRRATVAAAVLAAAAALLLTGCGPGANPPGKAAATADDGQVQQMRQKVDAAESAAAQADSDATQNN
ncbi:hypothetical protein GCM10010495_70850 [Kitasatospora herbaricolor]|uniref:hypothetical protein n=1 Tax=Kitasatospora herbaricolor TaxID=68217 RepID=UPI00174DC309|nr:hypothetical protein [Kitasatospora herbaricolor]MDQ0313473.1 outer membrane biogenesis lipoprotein LolB [Kitasatospora herbaricolor]GGV43083.1 hypothetical protein GCM10010495_70850 [Kitasatospora herbaricolor]